MKAKRKIAILALILLLQSTFLGDYLAPFLWGKIEVSGLVCTCPDETVHRGSLYLRSITPDSLKQYDLDYSEVWLTERPVQNPDYQGTDYYLVWGEVIGKHRVSKGDSWNPVIEVKKWKHQNSLLALLAKLVLIIEYTLFAIWLLIWIIYLPRDKSSPDLLDHGLLTKSQ